MPTRIYITAVLAVAFIVAPVSADWDPGDDHKMHWPQLPDLTPEGMDVLAGLAFDPLPQPALKVLADDFRCEETGLITDIHIWGSWLNDEFPLPPNHGTFVLGIYDDIPAVAGTNIHSRPGELLWDMQFRPGEYIARDYAIAPENFYDPNIDQIIGIDTAVWQYNFFIDEPLALQQEEGKIYWLAVTNVDPNGDGIVDTQDLVAALAGINRFGWKTSQDNFNDDAVFIDLPDAFGLPVDAITPPQGELAVGLPWQELRYPLGHPFETQSIDLAFVITPEPATLALLTLGTLAVLRRR
jgi:PEP-CTERM motif